jgi:hypothetical protein
LRELLTTARNTNSDVEKGKEKEGEGAFPCTEEEAEKKKRGRKHGVLLQLSLRPVTPRLHLRVLHVLFFAVAGRVQCDLTLSCFDLFFVEAIDHGIR